MNTIQIKQIIRTGIFLLLLPIFFGCEDNAASSDSDQVILTEEQREAIKKDREQLMATIEEQLKAADQEIDKINQLILEQGTDAAQEIDAQYDQTLTDLTTLRNELDTKMKEIGEATDENWEQFKTDIDPYINKVDNDLDSLAKNFESVLKETQK